jgi:hypothetical protein
VFEEYPTFDEIEIGEGKVVGEKEVGRSAVVADERGATPQQQYQQQQQQQYQQQRQLRHEEIAHEMSAIVAKNLKKAVKHHHHGPPLALPAGTFSCPAPWDDDDDKNHGESKSVLNPPSASSSPRSNERDEEKGGDGDAVVMAYDLALSGLAADSKRSGVRAAFTMADKNYAHHIAEVRDDVVERWG